MQTLFEAVDQTLNNRDLTFTTPASSGAATHTHGYFDTVEGNYTMVSASFKEASGIVLTAEQIDSNIHLGWTLP